MCSPLIIKIAARALAEEARRAVSRSSNNQRHHFGSMRCACDASRSVFHFGISHPSIYTSIVHTSLIA